MKPQEIDGGGKFGRNFTAHHPAGRANGHTRQNVSVSYRLLDLFGNSITVIPAKAGIQT